MFKRIVALSEAVLVKYGNLRNMIKYILIKNHLSLGPECFFFFLFVFLFFFFFFFFFFVVSYRDG